ncbi:MAG: DUF1289 domain-containing protein [Alphaproteobacteria bacterium]|nr:DUF1289 domain-containing protein [Alphaproteobacteria bacterium]
MSRSLPDIPSPCIGVCALDPQTGRCLGCLRTGEEIREWPRADNPRRYEILQDLKARRIESGRVSESDLRPRRRRRAP